MLDKIGKRLENMKKLAKRVRQWKKRQNSKGALVDKG